MATAISTNYGLTRVREASPDTADWVATDGNIEVISLLLKALEQHHHSGTTPFNYPGYNALDPLDPELPTLTESTSGGIITPGTSVGVRLSYKDVLGLETSAAPENTITLGSASARPSPPGVTSVQTAASALSGGTYIYCLTKKKGSGETVQSDILPVSILYDQTYSVTLNFAAINSYTDGTTSLAIYRANGLNSAFQLVTNITSTSQVAYTDTGASVAGYESIQPPSTNSFDASRKIVIDWSALSHPAGAVKLRVYVTQQTGIWGNNCLLSEYDLPGAPTFVNYLGSESLSSDTPLDGSQLVSQAPKVDLSTEATGAPTLTANMNFAGFQALNLRLHNNSGAPSSPTNGYIYYDTSTNNVRAYINGSWVTWGTTTASAYTHPAEESGGHISANIKYLAGSTNTVKTVLDRISVSTGTSTAGNAKQVQTKVIAVGTTSNPTTTNSSPNTSFFVPEMQITLPTSTFTQQDTRIEFSGTFFCNVTTTIGFMFEVGGVQYTSTSRYYQAPVAGFYFTVDLRMHTGSVIGVDYSGATAKVLWWVNGGGTLTAINLQRALEARLIF